jgi:hypothetical protein
VTAITYDELAAGLEDAWLMAGLHEHALYESVHPETLDRAYRVELFPEHPEPLDEGNSPPWVEMSYSWTPAHQLHAEGRDISPGVLELAWTYTVDVRGASDRSDLDLVRAFNGAVRAALRRVAPDMPSPAEYIAVEVRRGYRSSGDKPALAYTQIVGTNVTDLSDLWSARSSEALREALRDELLIVAALLHALAETFAPGGIGGYRSVDTA